MKIKILFVNLFSLELGLGLSQELVKREEFTNLHPVLCTPLFYLVLQHLGPVLLSLLLVDKLHEDTLVLKPNNYLIQE